MSTETFNYEVILCPGTEREMKCLVSCPESAIDLITAMGADTFVLRKFNNIVAETEIVWLVMCDVPTAGHTQVQAFWVEADASKCALDQGRRTGYKHWYVFVTLCKQYKETP